MFQPAENTVSHVCSLELLCVWLSLTTAFLAVLHLPTLPFLLTPRTPPHQTLRQLQQTEALAMKQGQSALDKTWLSPVLQGQQRGTTGKAQPVRTWVTGQPHFTPQNTAQSLEQAVVAVVLIQIFVLVPFFMLKSNTKSFWENAKNHA